MPTRYPSLWLMTDERLGDALWTALRRLPPGSGVVFRHYSFPRRERLALWLAVRRRARARGLMVLSGATLLPGADGVHGGAHPLSAPAHDRQEAVTAVCRGAALLFASPVFATRSHPGAKGIGPVRAARIGRGLGVPLIALGGMDARRWRAVRNAGFAGWAGIDAWGGGEHPAPSPAKAGAQLQDAGDKGKRRGKAAP